MTIGIVGNYGNDNLGDDAILEGIIIQLEDAYQISRNEILVFSNNPEQTRQKYGVQSVNLFQRKKTDAMKFIATMVHHKPIIGQLDVLLIGGGGILMDLYRNGPIVYGMYGWLARRANTPVAIYGAGAGPIESTLGKILLRSLVNGAEMVTVRDPKSKKLLESIGVNKQIDVISDPAFFVEAPGKKAQAKKGFHIGVTAVPYCNKTYWPVDHTEKYHHYIRGMAQNLDHIIEANPDTVIHFFSTKHPYDTEAAKDIRQLMKHKDCTAVLDRMLTHEEVLQIISGLDLVIGTRLHSLILAIVTETPVLAVSYHRKVQDFMDSADCGRYVISIDKLHEHPRFFLDQLHEMRRSWDGTRTRFKAILHDLKNKTPSGMELLKHIYPKH
ncbi:polysaccharide pyruvyl transferase [Pueribacillus theae]|uniref:Polysaccharide pyruvyl transferase n=1 Tax=Pueribacillus theae TaxID=2171751 RepID=A0A2U1JLK6_9BACI|nr:polysaccharide pyruvyl transferase family protein [Pueribacillus theae]PWA05763.1 polysaccharide pyruvyl transferase [Pueribacillus theae]